MILPPILRFPRLGYWILHIVLIPAVFGGGVALGISHANGHGGRDAAHGPDAHAGHGAALPASDNPIKDEMIDLQVAYDKLNRAVVLGDATDVAEAFHRVHARKQNTSAAIAAGTAKPPKNANKIDEFVARDEVFHAVIERAVRAAEQGDIGAMRSASVELRDGCIGCHEQFRAGPFLTPERSASDTAALAKADEAAMRLVTTLKGRVREEMGKGGPVAVVDVCSAEAPAIATKIKEETGVTLGRSSLKLRNPNNKAPDWVAAWLTEQGARPAAEATPLSVVDGGYARVLKPIAMEPPCLTCHGAPETIAPDVKAAIASRYPTDAATGYAAGDLRGAVWAEVAVGP